MSFIRAVFAGAAALALTATIALAVPIQIGPAPGSPVPQPFTAVDSLSGQARDLQSLMGEKGLVLAFVRSAEWCPFCQQQLVDLNTIQDDLAERGFALASLSYDAPGILREFILRRDIGYVMLSDRQSAMIDAFGIRETELYQPGSRAWGVPKPAIFIIDNTGVIRASLAEESYRDRPATDLILSAVDGMAE